MKAIPAREKQDPTLSVVDKTLSWCGDKSDRDKSDIVAGVEMFDQGDRIVVTLDSWAKPIFHVLFEICECNSTTNPL